jgi:hypothetical protein
VIGEPLEKHLPPGTKKPIIRENDVPALLAEQSSIGQDLHCAQLVVDNAIGSELLSASSHDKFVPLLATEIGRLTSRQSQSRKYSAAAAVVAFLPEGG